MQASRTDTSRTEQWDGRGRGTPLGNRLFMTVVRWVGVLPAYLLLFPACLSYALFDRRARAGIVSLRNHLGLRLGRLSTYRHIYCFGMSLVDRFSFLLLDRSPFTYTCIHEDRIAQAAAAGKGVILLSAHVGNWEIAGNLLKDRLGVPINVMLLDAEREALQRIYRPALEQRRFRTIPFTPGSPDASVEMMARLRAGEIVCLLGDRLLEGRRERVGFLGAPAAFPVGAFALALASDAPVVPVFTIKTGLRHYTFSASEPIHIEAASRSHRDRALRDGLETFVGHLERMVRAHPYQWYNLYDFWA
jgi:predicted LPLAT superfamily acyltransferase